MKLTRSTLLLENKNNPQWLLRRPIFTSSCLTHVQEKLRTTKYSFENTYFYFLVIQKSQCKLTHIHLTSLSWDRSQNKVIWNTLGWWWALCVGPDTASSDWSSHVGFFFFVIMWYNVVITKTSWITCWEAVNISCLLIGNAYKVIWLPLQKVL